MNTGFAEPETLAIAAPVVAFPRMLERHGLSLPRTPLEILQVNLTARCNLACTDCYAGDHHLAEMTGEVRGRATELLFADGAEVAQLGFFGGEPFLAFGAMKEGAYLINIARGPIVKTEALLAALESGQLAGACLDVTDPEPLPADSPLWDRPDVVITPHSASVAELTNERRWVLFKENIRRFGAGEPLLNTVDKAAGY